MGFFDRLSRLVRANANAVVPPFRRIILTTNKGMWRINSKLDLQE